MIFFNTHVIRQFIIQLNIKLQQFLNLTQLFQILQTFHNIANLKQPQPSTASLTIPILLLHPTLFNLMSFDTIQAWIFLFIMHEADFKRNKTYFERK